MKGYFFLLCVLCLSKVLVSLWGLVTASHLLVGVVFLGDVVLLPLCTLGCYALAFKKVVWSAGTWGAIRLLTLALGVFAVVVFGYGEQFGVPSIGQRGMLTIALVFLPYLLFAIPVILYENALKKGFEGTAAG